MTGFLREDVKVNSRSRPGSLGQVSRPIGQPEEAIASGGVSSTKSPGGGHPPMKVW